MSENMCLCGSGLEYENCCARYIENGDNVPDAASMVRSRYTAYCLQKYAYHVESTHPDFREKLTAEIIEKYAKDIKWLSLELGEEKEYISAEGECFRQISFVAHYEKDGKPRQLSETSFFKEKDERLYYVHGVAKKPVAHKRILPKIGRNDICPCGSNKKYKKCCGK